MAALGCAYMLTGGFEEGLKWTTRALRGRPGFAPALRFHAVCLAQLGRSREARETVDHSCSWSPALDLAILEQTGSHLRCEAHVLLSHSLRKAGMPG